MHSAGHVASYLYTDLYELLLGVSEGLMKEFSVLPKRTLPSPKNNVDSVIFGAPCFYYTLTPELSTNPFLPK